jgi:hypothetical protein
MKATVLMATGAAGLIALTVADAAYRIRDWGAADGEVSAELPGDDILPDPGDVSTLAVSIGAPVETVWQELLHAVTGDRGSCDPRHSTGGPAAGDVVRCPSGARSGVTDGPLRVIRVCHRRYLVLAPAGTADDRETEGTAGARDIRSFHVVPSVRGRCRLLFRRRLRGGGLGEVMTRAVEPAAIVRTRLLMLGVAEQAERRVRDGRDQEPASGSASRCSPSIASG